MKQRFFVAACCVVEADSEEEAQEIAHASDIEWTIQSSYLIDRGEYWGSSHTPRPLSSPQTPEQTPQSEAERVPSPRPEVNRPRRWYNFELPTPAVSVTAPTPVSRGKRATVAVALLNPATLTLVLALPTSLLL